MSFNVERKVIRNKHFRRAIGDAHDKALVIMSWKMVPLLNGISLQKDLVKIQKSGKDYVEDRMTYLAIM